MVTKRTSPENKVKKECLSRLEQWQKWGFVLDFDDVSGLGRRCFRGQWMMKTVIGKRDIIALFKVKNIIWVYLIEVKAPKKYVWSKEQQDYARRFAWIDNVVYEVVNDASQIDTTLERITGRSDNILKDIKI